MLKINSTQNSLIKKISLLSNRKDIILQNQCFVEGGKIIIELINNYFTVKTILVSTDKLEDFLPKVKNFKGEIIEINKIVADKISNTVNSAGIFALVELPKTKNFNKDDKYIVLDNIQDPTNLGSVIRSALAFNYKQIILINCVYPYLPKVIRSSMGYALNANFYMFSENEFVSFAKVNNLNLICGHLSGEDLLNFKADNINYGIVIGNEGNGVSNNISNICQTLIKIPINDNVESLNAAVSAAILMFYLNNKG